MKLSALALVLFALASPAMAQEVTCTDSSNSDYELRLDFSGSSPVRMGIFNQDWGSAGWSGWQPVLAHGPSVYEATDGTELTLSYSAGVLTNVDVSVRGAQSQSYHCN